MLQQLQAEGHLHRDGGRYLSMVLGAGTAEECERLVNSLDLGGNDAFCQGRWDAKESEEAQKVRKAIKQKTRGAIPYHICTLAHAILPPS